MDVLSAEYWVTAFLMIVGLAVVTVAILAVFFYIVFKYFFTEEDGKHKDRSKDI